MCGAAKRAAFEAMSDFTIRVAALPALQPLSRFLDRMQHRATLAASIAALGESSTRLRFVNETGPDGKRWPQSLRARLHGGKTLTLDGHLSGSISARSGESFAEWGVNRVYAAIHQFGGEIRPRHKRALYFRLANGKQVAVAKVTMPPRPFLGISEQDEEDIADLVASFLGDPLGAG